MAADPAKAATCLGRAAARGDARAQYDLGVLYSRAAGVPRDYVRAYGWLSLAAQGADGDVARVSHEGARRIEAILSERDLAEPKALGSMDKQF